ncbi:MAG: 1,6-anhydro-N-acetylmuramyl-L-alanine amidase AmpD [Gammaproteobacteria bacterium]|nr:1,6-anhydro-N-acetylmuramyl-L-alanine amidase AmpD [Gammaproteobacteria bacterium]
MKVSFARQVTSHHFNQRPDGADVDLLVIHNISLPPGEFGGNYIEQFFLGNLDSAAHPFFKEIEDLRVAAHFLIKRDGEVIQFIDTEHRAWHAGVSIWQGRENCNDYSIGIELEGTDDLNYEPEQYDALVQLTQALIGEYPGITLERIVGHCDIAPGRKTDPGKSFDWSLFKKRLTESKLS